MSLRINHNISSINGHRQLMKNEGMMAKSLERLSSGLKINRAADDAAGLVISEQMRAQISGLKQGIDNSETAISMVQTTEGALDEVNTLLTKARELTLHAANEGANDVNQLIADQTELDNVIQSITRISDVTQFGTKKLLDGSLNGAKDLATGIAHVKVGNLANNPGISAGKLTVNITKATAESVTLGNSVSGTDSYIFSSAVTGVNIGSASVNSGVSVSLKLGNDTIAHVVTSGGQTANSLAGSLDTLADQYGFDVTEESGNIKVTRQDLGDIDIDATITFSRAAKAEVTGTKEAVTAKLEVTSPSTSATAADQLFQGSLTGIESVQGTSVLAKSQTRFTYNITVGTGSFSAVVTGAANDTVDSVLTALQTSIRSTVTTGLGFSGATLTLGGANATGQLNFKLTKDSDAIDTDFTFSLSVDYDNDAAAQSEVEVLRLNNAAGVFASGIATSTFNDGSSGVAPASLSGAGGDFLGSDSAINLTINGQTIAFTGGVTLASLASTMQTDFQALSGDFANVRVVFLTGGTQMTGQAGYQGAASLTTGIGYAVYSANGSALSVSLSIDQEQGNDVTISGAEQVAGAEAGMTLDLTTVAQSGIQSVVTSGAQAAATVSSDSGSTVTNGVDATATMTSSNGVVLNLKQELVNADGTFSMVLTTGSEDLGYSDFSAEFSATLQSAGGQTSFTLAQGAVFQVGANALQQVAFTIQDTSAGELGRGASSKLASLEDMLSTKEGALLNGMSTEALAVIDAAIDEVTNLRGRLGAFQANALESGLNSLRVSYENLTAAESTIRDVDFAEESANFTRNQILVQASTSMLAQANQMPQNVLKLLG